MTGKELRAIRKRLGLTQVGFADRIRVARNTVVRMENGQMIITPPMELLIQFVAREAGVEPSHKKGIRRKTSNLREAARKSPDTVRTHGKRPRKDILPG